MRAAACPRATANSSTLAGIHRPLPFRQPVHVRAIIQETDDDSLSGGRNADFFFAELSLLDPTDGDSLSIDGGNTADDLIAGLAETSSTQDTDWLLLEASDDDEPVIIDLDTGAGGAVSSIRSAYHKGYGIDDADRYGPAMPDIIDLMQRIDDHNEAVKA